jgi:mannose-1-phosphate guanylyltransferase
MRYALILAGGSGTRLWPMSRADRPKHLLPLVEGRSLLQLAYERLDGLIPPPERYICSNRQHTAAILAALPKLAPEQLLGEPVGRDTLNAVGLGAAILGHRDPQAVVAVLTADHLIAPTDRFQAIIGRGLALAEASPHTLVTFGIAPTHAATAYGYLELGGPIGDCPNFPGHHRAPTRSVGRRGRENGTVPFGAARRVARFREKPDEPTARGYLAAGPERYLWNSGMFVWRAATLLECIRRYAPASHAGLTRIARAWDGPQRQAVLDEVYPALPKISVDYAVMEPVSADADFQVAAIPMPLDWRDIGSWTAWADVAPRDADGNALAAPRHLLLDTRGTLVASSDPSHLIAVLGCEDLVIVHTPEATLVCRASRAEDVKKIQALVAERFGP